MGFHACSLVTIHGPAILSSPVAGFPFPARLFQGKSDIAAARTAPAPRYSRNRLNPLQSVQHPKAITCRDLAWRTLLHDDPALRPEKKLIFPNELNPKSGKYAPASHDVALPQEASRARAAGNDRRRALAGLRPSRRETQNVRGFPRGQKPAKRPSLLAQTALSAGNRKSRGRNELNPTSGKPRFRRPAGCAPRSVPLAPVLCPVYRDLNEMRVHRYLEGLREQPCN